MSSVWPPAPKPPSSETVWGPGSVWPVPPAPRTTWTPCTEESHASDTSRDSSEVTISFVKIWYKSQNTTQEYKFLHQESREQLVNDPLTELPEKFRLCGDCFTPRCVLVYDILRATLETNIKVFSTPCVPPESDLLQYYEE